MKAKFLIPAALLVSLGANTYFVAGGAEQYAVAADTINYQTIEDVKNQCTGAQRALFAPILTDHILDPLNTKYSTAMTVSDMRPLNKVEMTIELTVPSIGGIPQTGAPTGRYCQFHRRVWARKVESLATPGE